MKRKQPMIDVREVVQVATGISIARDGATWRVIVANGAAMPEDLEGLAREAVRATVEEIKRLERTAAFLSAFIAAVRRMANDGPVDLNDPRQ